MPSLHCTVVVVVAVLIAQLSVLGWVWLAAVPVWLAAVPLLFAGMGQPLVVRGKREAMRGIM